MEVDDEIGADLLRKFNCMSTSDKDVLVGQLKGLLTNDPTYSDGRLITDEMAKFYLDMADWNLEGAVGAYFDLESSVSLPRMSFVEDITIGEGESVPPNSPFSKKVRVSNSGTEMWPPGCRLIHTGGPELGVTNSGGPLGAIGPGVVVDLSLEMVAPALPGHYCSQLRLATVQGHFFGDTIWVMLDVAEGGTLALMQQMSNLGSTPPSFPSAHPGSPTNPFNPSPFGTPSFPTLSTSCPNPSGFSLPQSPLFHPNMHLPISPIHTPAASGFVPTQNLAQHPCQNPHDNAEDPDQDMSMS